MPEREGGGAICDGHALFYLLDTVTTTDRKDSAGAGERSWPVEKEVGRVKNSRRLRAKTHPLKITKSAAPPPGVLVCGHPPKKVLFGPMASHPIIPDTPTCRFTKGNGEFCRRSVSPGEGMCWQHAKTWHHRIRSLTRNQTVIFILAIAGIIIGIPSLYFSYVGSRYVPPFAIPPAVEQSPKLKVDVVGFMIPSYMWLVRSDTKQYFPADVFILMRLTNLTNEEILVDTLNVEIIGKGDEPPLKVFPLGAPDEQWHMYCGPSTKLVVPCTIVNRGFLLDVLRQPIAAGHTIYAVGLFQAPRGKDLSDPSGLSLHITDMRGKKYDIGGIIPAESPSGSLEQFTIKNGHPVADISAYAEQRPLFPD
jgi:hypothetical protein